MDLNRLKEIVESHANVEITYNSHPVWINEIDEKRELAKVRILETKQQAYIPIYDLYDTGKIINMKK